MTQQLTGTDWRASSRYLYVSIINKIGTSQVQYTVAIKATNPRRLMLCLGFQHDQRRLQSSQWEGQQRMRYEDRKECTFSETAYPTNMTTRMWTHEPTDVDFQMLMVTASGLIMQFLKVLENYQNVKWMRYPTKAEETY